MLIDADGGADSTHVLVRTLLYLAILECGACWQIVSLHVWLLVKLIHVISQAVLVVQVGLQEELLLLLLRFEVFADGSLGLGLSEVGLLRLDGGELLLVLELLLVHLLSLYLSNTLINHRLSEIIGLINSYAFGRHFLLQSHDLWIHFKSKASQFRGNDLIWLL